MSESELLMWKNPVKTGAVVSGFNALFFIAVYSRVALVPLLCNLFMMVIFLGGAIKFAAPQLAEQSQELITMDAVEKAVASTAKALNKAASKAQKAVLWSSQKSTIQALIGLEIARRLAPLISLSFVCFVCGNSIFIVPYLLEAKKDFIQKSIEPHITKAIAMKDSILAKVPKYTDVM